MTGNHISLYRSVVKAIILLALANVGLCRLSARRKILQLAEAGADVKTGKSQLAGVVDGSVSENKTSENVNKVEHNIKQATEEGTVASIVGRNRTLILNLTDVEEVKIEPVVRKLAGLKRSELPRKVDIVQEKWIVSIADENRTLEVTPVVKELIVFGSVEKENSTFRPSEKENLTFMPNEKDNVTFGPIEKDNFTLRPREADEFMFGLIDKDDVTIELIEKHNLTFRRSERDNVTREPIGNNNTTTSELVDKELNHVTAVGLKESLDVTEERVIELATGENITLEIKLAEQESFVFQPIEKQPIEARVSELEHGLEITGEVEQSPGAVNRDQAQKETEVLKQDGGRLERVLPEPVRLEKVWEVEEVGEEWVRAVEGDSRRPGTETEPVEAVVLNPLMEVGTGMTSLGDKVLMVEETVCGQSCRTFPLRRQPRRWGTCQQCHCDVTCSYFRDCCPDVILRYNVTYDAGAKLTECRNNRAVVLDQRNLGSSDYQTMVTQCPIREAANNEDKTKCESPDVLEKDQFLLVSSPVTGLTYRNIFCARCHDDARLLGTWDSVVKCEHSAGPLLAGTHTKEEFYRKLATNSSVQETQCELVFQPPTPTHVEGPSNSIATYSRPCSTVISPIIDTCNATGLQWRHNAQLEDACALYDSVFAGRYRNMFCFLCNQVYPYSLESLRQYVQFGDTANVARVSFSALVDFADQNAGVGATEEGVQCGGREFLDLTTCSCRELQCSEGKYLDANGTCQSLMTTDLLGYTACYRLDVTSDNPIPTHTVRDVLIQAGMLVSQEFKEHDGYVLEYCPAGSNASLYFRAKFSKYGVLEDLQEIVNRMAETYNFYSKLHLGMVKSSEVTVIYPCPEEGELANPCPSDPMFMTSSTHTQAPRLMGETNEVHYINFTQTSNCSYASVPKDDFTVTAGGVELEFKPTGRRILASRVTQTSWSSQIYVCKSDYLALTETVSRHACQRGSTDFDTWQISGLVSVISTSVSLFCLALTFATYLLLGQLRKGGGKNIMMLTALLFTAQALYEFGIEQYENEAVCRVIGVSIHYSWLAAVTSMSACTVERFLKLCYPLATRSFFLSDLRPFLLATSYTLITPLLIVAANIAVNLQTTGDIGYGSSSLCYINSLTARIAAFAVPMGIIVTANFVLLGITILKLRGRSEVKGANRGSHMSSTSSTKASRVGLLACVKLSAVAGLTFLLIFVYEATPSRALEYVITALIGLQGVLFFFSMVVNKRVLRMLRETLGKWQMGVSVSSTSKLCAGSHSNKANVYTYTENSDMNGREKVTCSTSTGSARSS